MPYVNKPRPYKKEYQQQLERGEAPTRKKRAQARYAMDKKGVDRKGKDINHVVPLSKGGGNGAGNLKLTTPSKNRSFSRNSDHTVKINRPKKLAEGGMQVAPKGETPNYGQRLDKTKKGRGWLGEQRMEGKNSNSIATELSMGIGMGGKESLIPSMVPGLTKAQVNRLLSGKFSPSSNNPDDTAIKRRAVAHAKKQIRAGKSAFKD